GAIGLLTVLSLVPGEDRPHVLASGFYEHFAAYFLTSSALAIGYRSKPQALRIICGLSALSAIFEILQIWIPGRTSKFQDFVVSSTGATVGVVVVLVALSLLAHNRKRTR